MVFHHYNRNPKITAILPTMVKARARVKGGGRRVLISTPSVYIPIYIMGMKHKLVTTHSKLSAMSPVPPTA